MTDFLAQNATELAKHPHLVALVERERGGSGLSGYIVEKARNGSPTLSVKNEEGKSFTYHSKYDPETEARRQVESAVQGHSHIVMLGMGLGYSIDQVVERLISTEWKHQVLVIEPDPKVFFQAVSSRDMRNLLGDFRLDWCIGMTPDQIGDAWNIFLDWAVVEKIAILEHPATLARFPEFSTRLKEKIRYLSRRSRGNLVTLMYLGNEFHVNTFVNLPETVRLPGVSRLFGKFRGNPAILVAAGPSLEKNVHLLQEVQERFLIIATDTAFRQLVTHGIRPHIVCAADPSYLNSLDFVGVEDEKDVTLAFEPMTHPDIVDSFKGPKMVMTFGGSISMLVEPFREPIGKLVSWGSISTSVFDLARKCECDPIIFIGLDLSFQDGRLYARGSYSDDVFFDKVHHFTSLEHEILEYVMTRGTIQYRSADGKTLFTDANMNMYKGWFEDQFRQTSQKIINATEGGIVSQFVTTMTLRQTIDENLARGAPVREILAEATRMPVQADIKTLTANLAGFLRELRTNESNSRDGLNLCRKLAKADSEIPARQLSGQTRAQLEDMLALHDKMCAIPSMMSWFSMQQAKFMTRHTMEVKNLRADKTSKLGPWLTEMKAFFETVDKFHGYQIPLLERAVSRLEILRDHPQTAAPVPVVQAEERKPV